MTAFYIGQHEIDDEVAFAEYLKQTMPFIEKHGGRYLTKAGTHEMLEGQRPSRVVVVEFPSKQAIKDWYNDPGYQPLIAKRTCGGAQRHDRGGRSVNVRFAPKSGHVRCNYQCPLRANSGHQPSFTLF
jgi:uncharacterized protein (DUF1330 family)